MSIEYDHSRYPKQPAKKKCRGCHTDVPPGRMTWCSNECFNKYEPKRVRHFCKKRDLCICHHCGINAEKMRKRYEHATHWYPPSQHQYVKNGVFDRAAYDRALMIAQKHQQQWYAAANKRKQRMRDEGWPYDACRDWWEMDHIIPFSEGGITVLENVRTLCVVCHKKRTKAWHKSKVKHKASTKSP